MRVDLLCNPGAGLAGVAKILEQRFPAGFAVRLAYYAGATVDLERASEFSNSTRENLEDVARVRVIAKCT